SCWCRLRIRGTAGHGSQPFRTDNALVTAAEVVRRLAAYRPTANIHAGWRAFVEGMGWDEEVSAKLLDPHGIEGHLEAMPELGLAREAHACTHLTIAPTILHGGSKVNVIPDTVELDLDVRTLPGQDETYVRSAIADAVGELSEKVEIVTADDDPSTTSPIETPLWESMARVSRRFHPDAPLVPFFLVGATDARFFRRLGSTAYGFGMFSNRLSFEQFAVMFHGDDERVDVDSLQMSTDMFEHLARDLLG
ncbi:MAG: M20/M25/M40 family metallo-hydrolase, partial [Acidimicrobiales bacterium]